MTRPSCCPQRLFALLGIVCWFTYAEWSFAQTAPPTAPTPSNSLTLAAATTLALSANPNAHAAQYQVAQAQAKLAQAQAQQRWQISFSSALGVSNAGVLQPPPSQETFREWTNTFSVPLPVGRKPRLEIAQADARVTAAQAQQDSARLNLASQVGTAYYDLLRKQALLKLAQETLTTAERQRDETQKRVRAGDAPELDALRAQVPVATAQAGLIQAQAAVDVAQQTLNGLLGQPLDTAVNLAEVEPIAPGATMPMTLEEAQARALKNSPDVRAAEATVLANERALASSRLSREPTYALQATDMHSTDVTGFGRLDGVQATVTLPLSDGGLARAQVKEAEAAVAQSKALRDAARQTVRVTVGTAYRSAESSLRLIEAARSAQEIAQTSYDKATRGYQAGLFPLTDVLSAQSALTQAKIAYTQAVYDAAAANAVLNNALGVLPQ